MALSLGLGGIPLAKAQLPSTSSQHKNAGTTPDPDTGIANDNEDLGEDQPAGRVRKPSSKQVKIDAAKKAKAEEAAERKAREAAALKERNRPRQEVYAERLSQRGEDLVVNPLDKPNPPKKKKKKTAAPAPLPTDNNIPPPKTVPSAKPPALSAKPSAKPAKTASASNGAATGAARVVGMTIQSDNEEDEEDEEDTGAGGPGNLAWDERAEDVDAPRPDDGDDDEEEWEDIERQLNELEVAPPKSRGRTHAGGAGKRKPSRSPSADADQPHRRPRNSNNSAHGRAKASDYSMRTQAILKVAWGHYRVWLATVNPFPDYEDAYVVAIQAWERACAEIGDDIAIEPEYIKIILRTRAQMRGELKTITRPAARGGYTFQRRKSKISANRRKYRMLIHKNAFVFEDPTKRLMRWCHPILFDVIQELWFARSSSDGVKYAQAFGTRIPAPTIALVFTAVRNCLDEWKTGAFEPIQFKAQDYKSIYAEFLSDLEHLSEETLRAFGEDLWEDASDGFALTAQDGPLSTMTTEEQDAANHGLEEWSKRRKATKEAEEDEDATLSGGGEE